MDDLGYLHFRKAPNMKKKTVVLEYTGISLLVCVVAVFPHVFLCTQLNSVSNMGRLRSRKNEEKQFAPII